jgi:hypothetical protein
MVGWSEIVWVSVLELSLCCDEGATDSVSAAS